MAGDEPKSEDFRGTFEKLFGPPPSEMEALTLRLDRTAEQLSELEKEVRKTRQLAWENHAETRRLRRAAADLLGPVALAGMTAFFVALVHARGLWDYVMIAGFTAFGIFWLREAFKAFDDVTNA